jgi:hypothetical protein
MSSALDGKVGAGVVHSASDSIGAAIGAARELAPGAAQRVVDAAQSSFVSGMHVAVVVGAAIIAAGAIGVIRWLPARVAGDEHAHAPIFASDMDVSVSVEAEAAATEAEEEAEAAAGVDAEVEVVPAPERTSM